MVLPNGRDGSEPEVSHKRKRRRRGQQDESDKQLSSSASINNTAIKTMETQHGAATIATNITNSNSNSNSSHKESTSPSKKRRRGNQTKAPPLIANGPSSQEKLPEQSSNRNRRPSDHPRRKIPLSPAVLEFSTHLKELVRQKNLHSLLKCYYSNTYDDIRDEHHACIVIDACAKGGGTDHDVTTGETHSYTSNSIDTAEQIISHLQQQAPSSSGVTSQHQKTLSSFNVETLTALLKVYVHAGNLPKGWELFRTHIIHPNVRTLNTLLRGCLWSAVTMFEKDVTSSILQVSSITTPSNTKPINHPLLCGGVVTSENAWQHYLANFRPHHHSSVSSNKINSSITGVDTKRQIQQQGLDTSSYEYSIQLLCQSLQVNIATKRIEEYCTIHGIKFKGTAKIIQNHNNNSTKDIKNSLITSSATIFETLAITYLALSRAYALMIVLLRPMEDDTSRYSTLLWSSCQRCLSAIRLSRSMLLNQNGADTTLQDDEDGASTKADRKFKKEATAISAAGSGGKRSWKSGQQHQHSTQRELSNVAYRTHRLSEIEMDVLSLLKHSSKNNIQAKSETSSNREQSALSSSKEHLCFVAQQIQHKLLYFSGGAMTSASTSSEDRTNVKNRQSRQQTQKQRAPPASMNLNATTVRQQLLVASWYSFGLSQIYASITKHSDNNLDDDGSTREESNSVDVDFNQYTAMQSAAKRDSKSVIRDDGMLNVDAVFTSKDRPLDIEIGAGFGTWIVDQAKRHMDRNFIAMELRADRCYQIYTRAMLHHSEPLPNVCVVGCDCNILLRERITRSTVSTFYAHHPEPPTQVFGDNVKFLQQLSVSSNTNVIEPIHMLHSTTLLYMCQCLKKGGHIVIVSDNRSYIRLIAATFTKVARQHTNILRTMSLEEVKKGSVHSFDETMLESLRPFETFQSVVEIYAYENKVRTSNQKNGNDGTSYFDRLWRTGAGTHSETHTRFVIVMQKTAK